jgi:hypothetical protein
MFSEKKYFGCGVLQTTIGKGIKLISAESMCSNTVPAVNELSIVYNACKKVKPWSRDG